MNKPNIKMDKLNIKIDSNKLLLTKGFVNDSKRYYQELEKITPLKIAILLKKNFDKDAVKLFVKNYKYFIEYNWIERISKKKSSEVDFYRDMIGEVYIRIITNITDKSTNLYKKIDKILNKYNIQNITNKQDILYLSENSDSLSASDELDKVFKGIIISYTIYLRGYLKKKNKIVEGGDIQVVNDLYSDEKPKEEGELLSILLEKNNKSYNTSIDLLNVSNFILYLKNRLERDLCVTNKNKLNKFKLLKDIYRIISHQDLEEKAEMFSSLMIEKKHNNEKKILEICKEYYKQYVSGK